MEQKVNVKLRKKSFTLVEEACHKVRGFSTLYQQMEEKIILSGMSQSSLGNYGRKIAKVCLHFNQLPQHIGERQLNKYLAGLARDSKVPSLRIFPSCKNIYPIHNSQSNKVQFVR